MKSWKTTVLGVIAGLSLILPQIAAALDSDPATVFSLEAVIAGLGAMGIGIAARDNNKSSEQVGAK